MAKISCATVNLKFLRDYFPVPPNPNKFDPEEFPQYSIFDFLLGHAAVAIGKLDPDACRKLSFDDLLTFIKSGEWENGSCKSD